MFKDIIEALNKLNYIVTIQENNYIVREIGGGLKNFEKVLASIPCMDDKKEKKLLQCYFELLGVK